MGDGAGVYHKNVTRLSERHNGKAPAQEILAHSFRFVLVDLAAKGVKAHSHKRYPFLCRPGRGGRAPDPKRKERRTAAVIVTK